jgi:hypothetical protein
VWNVLRASRPELFEPQRLNDRGGVMALDAHLDTLVEMSRQMTANRIEPYLARLIDDVCVRCAESDASGYCPLRHVNSCVLFSRARLILEMIDAALIELGDRAHLASREDARET